MIQTSNFNLFSVSNKEITIDILFSFKKIFSSVKDFLVNDKVELASKFVRLLLTLKNCLVVSIESNSKDKFLYLSLTKLIIKSLWFCFDRLLNQIRKSCRSNVQTYWNRRYWTNWWHDITFVR